jgi:hypothetical protein
MTENTFEPAWAYPRQGWSPETGLAWHHGQHGDSLRLWLRPGMIGVTIHDTRGLEGLAWQEERLSPLPRTWVTRPNKTRFPMTAIYQAAEKYQYQSNITYGVTIDRGGIPVWPTPADDKGDRYTWFDPDGVPLLGVPDWMGFSSLPGDWQSELQTTRETVPAASPTMDDTFRRFIAQTFVPDSTEHQLTTDEICTIYQRWLEISDVPAHWWANKIHLGRWISESGEFRRWAGRTPAGYRRGFTGLRLPDGAWNE